MASISKMNAKLRLLKEINSGAYNALCEAIALRTAIGEKQALRILKKVNPRAYAQFQERTGNREEALAYFSASESGEELIHGAELAYGLSKYELARALLTKARGASERSLRESEYHAMYPFSESSGMGEAMSYLNHQDEHRRNCAKISAIEEKLAGLK